MLLAIDGYEANARVRVGIGRYAFELLTHIYLRMGHDSTGFEEARVYLPDRPLSHMPKRTPFWQYAIRKPKTLWTFWALPLSLRMDTPRPDVIFSPTHYIPRFTAIPRVMAIMDVSYLTYPELFRPQDLHKLVHWTHYSVTHAAAIITISEFSKNAIIKAYHVSQTKVHVVYPALPDVLVKKGMELTQNQVRLPKRYILSVGTLQPRKNFVRLIEAFSRLADTEIELCIVGKKGWMYEDILNAPSVYGVNERVHFLDFVPDEQLPELYTHAEVFALPSLYEGFGLPVLEAMVHGVSVVVSKSSSLPEIAGNAGIYVNPEEADSIKEGLGRALKEKGTQAEKARIKLGKSLAAKFNWDVSAKKTLEVLEQVANRSTSL